MLYCSSNQGHIIIILKYLTLQGVTMILPRKRKTGRVFPQFDFKFDCLWLWLVQTSCRDGFFNPSSLKFLFRFVQFFQQCWTLYAKVEDGPIKNDTIVTLDAATGSLLDHWGSNLFYMPHGLEVDAEGNTCMVHRRGITPSFQGIIIQQLPLVIDGHLRLRAR